MYLPTTASYDSGVSNSLTWLVNDDSSSNAPSGGGWSSLIGIITAICGNILISFALNTQRYAHMRLNHDREEWDLKQRKSSRRRDANRTSYGTQQRDIAEQRAEANAKSEPNGNARAGYTLEDPEGSTEAEPLIPHVDAGKASRGSLGSERQNEKSDDDPKENTYLKSPIWWLGISLMVAGEVGNFLAYGFAPASIVSPLGVVALISNCLIAPLLLGERFRFRDGVGVVIAIAGCVTVVLSASDSNPKLTPDAIWSLISRWEFETYLGITIFLIIALVVASNKFSDKTILIDLGLVGLFGGYTALSTKGIASLLSVSLWRAVTFPITYLLLAVLIFTAVMQIKYVNRALQHFNATMVIPTQFVLFTLSVIIGSAILYRDFEREAPGDAAKFVGGCALTFLGVWCITSDRGDDTEADEEYGEEDDAVDLVDEEGVQPEIREREDDTGKRVSLIGSSSTTSPQMRRHTTAEQVPPSTLVTSPLQFGGNSYPSASDLEQTRVRETLQPANSAAIHPDSSPISQEDSTTTDPQKPPPLHATTSAPSVPTTDLPSTFKPQTPLNRITSGPVPQSPATNSPTIAGRPHANGHHLDPTGPPSRLLNRHSVVGLLPGPLTSPLSSSLSAIVADSLRRGVDSPASTVRRRLSYGRKKSVGLSTRRANAAALKRHSIASGEMDWNEDESTDLKASAGRPQGRVRSLSATLGEMFGSSKRQRLESRESVLEEPPPGSGEQAAHESR